MRKHFILYLFWGATALVQSCANHSGEKTQQTDSLADDSLNPSSTLGTLADSNSGTAADTSYTAQINAPDNFFEDGSEPSDWDDAGFSDPQGFKHFLVQFKGWVQHDKMDSIINHTRFPLLVAKNKDSFVKKYPHLFDERMKNVVARQRLDRIFRNQHGAMFGQGDIWFTQDSGKYLIIAIHK
ncbi:hypothetical protein [Deminuibacter soli]|uniref:Uncharacterized protein n=1 Tax=Deminuibacter soli TaxID=2291815 RepID=A0A3E1NIV4_9BACT|nr:hypothetical protein [Deminuibacter soli]RFM27852.1 hypothetical protein DXN05_14250 [Deminuibacter soli]